MIADIKTVYVKEDAGLSSESCDWKSGGYGLPVE
jgi:hypothetical protein